MIFKTLDKHYRKIWQTYFSIANHANVGELQVQIKKSRLVNWKMQYGGANYYSWNNERGFHKGNPNLIQKIRIGNF